MKNALEKFPYFKRKENWIMIIGSIIAIIAISLPFLIMYFNKYKYKLTTFEDLGTVGDFFGGSTVGLLSFASLLFVTAAMFMQKEELELQREEISKTRKEYEITNDTMRKQAFDSIFFQMLLLQNTITKDIVLSEPESGKLAFRKLLKNLKEEKEIYEHNYFNDNSLEIIKELLNRNKTAKETLKNNIKQVLKVDLTDEILEVNNFVENPVNIEIANDLNKLLYSRKLYGKKNLHSILGELINRKEFSVEKQDIFYREENVINDIYEKFYKKNVLYIGHYYRNMYRIIKMIESAELDKKTKSNYRGILRAQLSTIELLMLFYNITYSEKGEEFKKLLFDKNFFDDHLKEIESDFLWGKIDIKNLDLVNGKKESA